MPTKWWTLAVKLNKDPLAAKLHIRHPPVNWRAPFWISLWLLWRFTHLSLIPLLSSEISELALANSVPWSLYPHFSFYAVLDFVFKPEQSSCQHTTWMRPRCWVTALPSWNKVGFDVVAHHFTSRKLLGMAITSHSPRRRFVRGEVHCLMRWWVKCFYEFSPAWLIAKVPQYDPLCVC